jgi:hypothetical protein
MPFLSLVFLLGLDTYVFMNEDASKSDQARGLGPGLDSLLLDTW